MSKRERISEFNRQNILATAKKLFLEKGVAQTTMDDIAREAEYSKSTIYVYFKSKDEIYNHIILEYIGLLRDNMCEALVDKGFPDGYFAICDVLIDYYGKYPLYFESILGEIKIPRDESEIVLVEIYNIGEEINAVIEEYIRSGIAAKKIRSDLDPLQTTFTLWASLSGVITLANKKEAYINKAMNITKEEFMNNGFGLLLKSISTTEASMGT
jgi:AcrR family transcriptional regulator